MEMGGCNEINQAGGILTVSEMSKLLAAYDKQCEKF